MPFAGNVLDQDHLARRDDPAFTVARGDLNAGVKVDDVLPPGRRMPVEIVVGLDLTKDDAGRRQTLRQLAGIAFRDPIDFNISEMRLAVRVDIKVVYAHF